MPGNGHHVDDVRSIGMRKRKARGPFEKQSAPPHVTPITASIMAGNALGKWHDVVDNRFPITHFLDFLGDTNKISNVSLFSPLICIGELWLEKSDGACETLKQNPNVHPMYTRMSATCPQCRSASGPIPLYDLVKCWIQAQTVVQKTSAETSNGHVGWGVIVD